MTGADELAGKGDVTTALPSTNGGATLEPLPVPTVAAAEVGGVGSRIRGRIGDEKDAEDEDDGRAGDGSSGGVFDIIARRSLC